MCVVQPCWTAELFPNSNVFWTHTRLSNFQLEAPSEILESCSGPIAPQDYKFARNNRSTTARSSKLYGARRTCKMEIYKKQLDKRGFEWGRPGGLRKLPDNAQYTTCVCPRVCGFAFACMRACVAFAITEWDTMLAGWDDMPCRAQRSPQLKGVRPRLRFT